MQDQRSLDGQFAEQRKLIARQGGWVEVATFPEPETSASLPLHKRPVLMELMERAEAGDFDLVLAEDLDRLARKQSVMHALVEHLDFCGVTLWTVRDGEVSDLHVTFKGHAAADELKKLRQKVRRGHALCVSKGRPPAGRPPYGYRAVKGGEPGKRAIYEPEAAIVRRIYEHYLAGVSTEAIRRSLNAESIASPGGGTWTRATLIGARTRGSGILSNPIYAGRTVYNRQSQPKDPRTGKVVRRSNPADQWVEGENAALAIVTRETWEATQRLRASRALPQPCHHRRPKHLLSDLLICGACGEKVTVRRYTPAPRRSPYFACSSYEKGKPCSNRRMVRGPEIEERVLRSLRENLLSPELIELAVTTYRAERARLAAERVKTRDSTERDLAAVRRKIANIANDIGEHGGSPALSRTLRDLETRERALEEMLPSTKPDMVVELHPQAARRYRQVVEDLGKALTGPEPVRARALTLLRSLITRVVVTPTPARTPVALQVVGDPLAILSADGSVRRDAASQAALISISA
jgi:DNA invertase Pin-like site-specific DNA recombinase